MGSPQLQVAKYLERTGLMMVMTYVRDPRPQLEGFDDPVLHQASRDAVLWLGVYLMRGLSAQQAYDCAYVAALHSAKDALLRRGT